MQAASLQAVLLKPLNFSGVCLVLFAAAALTRDNLEFLFYAGTLVAILSLLYLLDRRFRFSALALWGFNLWMLLHLAGGMGNIDGVRLYDIVIVPVTGEPWHLLRYDQLVHVYCYVVVAALVFEVLAQLLAISRGWLLWLTVLVATGIGALNEVVEFSAVVLVGSTGVGNYTNNAIDLVANLTGALAGAGLMTWRRRAAGPQKPPAST